MKKNRTLWLLFLPSVLGMALFYVLPFFLALNYSLVFRYSEKKEYGLFYYMEAIKNPIFRLGVKNFLLFSLIAIPAVVVFSLALALLLKKLRLGSGFLVFSLLLPFVVPSGSTALFWNTIFNLNGYINRLRFQTGLELVMWDSSRWSILIPVFLYLWKFCGFFALVFYAGLNQIPDEYYEIAKLEGSGKAAAFFQITLTYLSPISMIVLLLAFISTFKISRELFMLFGNYPLSNLYFFQHFLNNHFKNMNLSILCSASVLMILFTCAITVPIWFIQKRSFDTFEKRGEFNLFVSQNQTLNKIWKPVLTTIISFVFLLPVLFTLSNSFMDASEILGRYSSGILEQNMGDLSRNGLHFVNPSFIPSLPTVGQYRDFLLNPIYLRMFWNSVLLVVSIVAGHTAVSVTGAFAFLRIKGKYINAVFMLYMFLMVVPVQVMITPQYILFQNFFLENSYWPIILPAIFNPAGVFIVRLQMQGFPQECIEAAQISGAGELCIFRRILLPNIKGAIAVLVIYTFAEYWNIVDQAVVFISNQNHYPLSVFLSHMLQRDVGVLSAGSVVYLVPACLVFEICLLGIKDFLTD